MRGAVTAEELVAANEAAAAFYRQRLLGPHADGPRSYLTSRGFSTLLHDTPWTVGYAPAGWTNALDHLRGQGFDDQTVLEAGIASRTRRGTLIDRFRDRITFGIRDPDGHLVAFIGRGAPTAQQTSPKYLGSPTTRIYRKGEVLYGLHEHSERIRDHAAAVIVEGPLDAVAVSESADAAGMALCGTALTRQQAGLISSSVSDVVLCLDSDPAGRAAMVRTSTQLWANRTNVSAVVLPEGKDPASLSGNQLRRALRGAAPAERMVVDVLLEGRRGLEDNVEAQLLALKYVARVLAEAPPPHEAIAATELCRRTRLGHEVTAAQLTQAISQQYESRPVPEPTFTGRRVVQRIITDLAVIDIVPIDDGGGLKLVELAPGVTEDEVRQKTEPELIKAM